MALRPNPEEFDKPYTSKELEAERRKLAMRWENHWAPVAVWIAFYNFCRVHKSLRCTPAMEAGIADHIWTVRELLEAA